MHFYQWQEGRLERSPYGQGGANKSASPGYPDYLFNSLKSVVAPPCIFLRFNSMVGECSMIVNLGLMADHGMNRLHGSKLGPSGLHRAGQWMSSSPRRIFFSLL